MCGRNLREGRRTHSGQQELEGTSNDLGVIVSSWLELRHVLDIRHRASNWTVRVEPVNLDVAST